MRKVLGLVTIVILILILNGSVFAENNITIGSLARRYLGDDVTAEEMFDFAWQNDGGYSADGDDDSAVNLRSIYLRKEYAEFEFIDSEIKSASNEVYYIGVRIDDNIIACDGYIIFDFRKDFAHNSMLAYLNPGRIQIGDLEWTSIIENNCTFRTSQRPDGTLNFKYFFSSDLGYYNSVEGEAKLILEEDSFKDFNYSYRVDYEGSYLGAVHLYPDCSLRHDGNTYYLEGVERAKTAIELTSGNRIGNSSSNLYNGGKMAIEEDVVVYNNKNDDNYLERERLDGSDAATLWTEDRYALYSFNIIDGLCYFVTGDRYLCEVDLNGNAHGYDEDVRSAVADERFIYYTKLDGVYVLPLNNKSPIKMRDAYHPDHISLDQDWLYYVSNDRLYRTSTSFDNDEIVYEGNIISGYLVDNGTILIWDTDILYLITTNPDGSLSPAIEFASASEFGEYDFTYDHTAPMSLYNGWLYYYYEVDSSMICRRSILGDVVDEFVCYVRPDSEYKYGYDDFTKGIYIFNGDLYLKSDLHYIFKVRLDDSYTDYQDIYCDDQNEYSSYYKDYSDYYNNYSDYSDDQEVYSDYYPDYSDFYDDYSDGQVDSSGYQDEYLDRHYSLINDLDYGNEQYVTEYNGPGTAGDIIYIDSDPQGIDNLITNNNQNLINLFRKYGEVNIPDPSRLSLQTYNDYFYNNRYMQVGEGAKDVLDGANSITCGDLLYELISFELFMQDDLFVEFSNSYKGTKAKAVTLLDNELYYEESENGKDIYFEYYHYVIEDFMHTKTEVLDVVFELIVSGRGGAISLDYIVCRNTDFAA